MEFLLLWTAFCPIDILGFSNHILKLWVCFLLKKTATSEQPPRM